MIFRKEIGWLVAQAYVVSGVRRRIVCRCHRENLIVPVLMHGPTPQQLEVILEELDWLVGLSRVELTFDDGRRVLNDCVPVFERFGIRATFFISPGEILRGFNWAEECGNAFGKLCRMSAAEREKSLERAVPRRSRLLSVDDIRALSRHPLIEFGNHTWSHMSCANRPPEEAVEEIRRTQEQIAAWTGRTPTKFSYPFGHDCAEVDSAVRRMGLIPYCLRPGLVTEASRGAARNMAYEGMSVAENIGRLLTAWPKVRRMPL